MPPALLVLATPSSCSALVTCLTEGIALLTGAIANVPQTRWEGARLQSLSTATVFVCEGDVGLGPVAAET